MMYPIVSSLVYGTNRRAVLAAVPSSLKKLWKDWDLRLAILLSLSTQILLSILGNRRKHDRRLWISVLVWFAYTAADSVAVFGLGIISNNFSDKSDDDVAISHQDPIIELMTFWAQFSLLHLGGPDSITAYALEDNELWLRQLLGLASQTFGVLYVFQLSWTGRVSLLSFLSIMMLVAGFIKYAERIWALRAASSRSVLQDHEDDPCGSITKSPNYEMRHEYQIKSREGYIVGVQMCPQLAVDVSVSGFNSDSISEEGKLLTAYRLLFVTKRLFMDAALSFAHRDIVQAVYRNIPFQDAFELIEIQLGMMYDLRYTKAPLLHSFTGLVLRLITFSLTLSSLVLFSASLDRNNKMKYSKVDVSITLALLSAAFLLEVYAILVLLSSDWFLVWLSINHKRNSTMKTLASFPLLKSPRCSNAMSQYTLLSFTRKTTLLQSCGWYLTMGQLDYCQWDTEVTNDLKKMMFRYFQEKADELAMTGKLPFAQDASLPTPTEQVEEQGVWQEFEYRIIIWSIATEILYYTYYRGTARRKFRSIKRISRYMLYLLVKHPSLISAETSLMVVSCQQVADEVYDHTGSCSDIEFRDMMCKQFMEKSIIDRSNFRSDSLLKKGIELAQELQEDVGGERIGYTWMEMLAYAATKSKGNEHAQHLRRGGEFLTHIWLLMAHFGLTNHFKISKTCPVGRIFGK